MSQIRCVLHPYLKKLLLVVLFAVGASSTYGQGQTMIDGKKHPEQISDRVAARLYLEMVVDKIKRNNEEMFHLHTGRAGLTATDTQALETAVRILASDRAQLETLDGTDGDRFMRDLDAKIAALLSKLSPAAQQTFTTFLQGEKKNMRVSAYDYALSPSVRLIPPKHGTHIHIEPAAYRRGGGRLGGGGQGGSGMNPNYSTYNTSGFYSVSSGNSQFYLEAAVTGNTLCPSDSPLCFQNVHRGQVTATMGSYGGTTYGSYQQPVSYMNVDGYALVPISTIWSNHGSLQFQVNFSDGVFCTGLARFIYSDDPEGSSLFDSEFAVTEVQDRGLAAHVHSDGTIYYDVQEFCSAESSPADWQPQQVHSRARTSFTLGITWCFRIPDSPGIPWACLAAIAETLYKPGLKYTSLAVPWFNVTYDCTNKDKGFSGFSGFTIWPW
jgi:hypothetical protein